MSDVHVDDLREAIEATQLERQRLRDAGAPRPRLERNRRQLVELQQQFSYALIELYGGASRRAA